MAEDPFSPRTPPKSLGERLGATGAKIANLSKQAAHATKEAVGKVADAGKEAVSKTNEAVSNAVESRREKKEEKLTQKIDETRAEMKDNGFIDVAPAMITLPEFEEERMAVMAEEHDILVDLVEHMHALSTRVDQLERTYKALAMENKLTVSSNERNASLAQPAIFKLMYTSVAWVAILIGLDQAISQTQITIFSTYPAEVFTWSIGTGLWVVYILQKIGKAAPLFKASKQTLVQFGLFTGTISLFLLLMSEDKVSTMSTIYVAGLTIALAILFTSKLVRDESEVIG